VLDFLRQNCRMKKETSTKRRGVAMIYALVIMTAFCMILSLAVDFGHAQVVKTELRRTADASARAAAGYIYTSMSSGTAAALDVAKRNSADGTPVVLDATQDIQYGYWNVNTKTFTSPVTDSSTINAVRVVTHRSAARGNAVPMMFASVMGRDACDVQAEAIVMNVGTSSVETDIQATANPFLSGMPQGSVASEINPHNDPDYAGTPSNPMASPQPFGFPISSGEALSFDSLTGNANHDPNLKTSNPDGDLDDTDDPIGHNNLTTSQSGNYTTQMYSENGIADAWIPINAVVGIFLDDNAPSATPTPSTLDFRDPNDPNNVKDFTTLTPGLKQIFFIGDGLNKAGQHQQFIAPHGATRLFLATMDYYEWSNNSGYRKFNVTLPSRLVLVK
jgi:Flp pilus assembly protein TadG